MFGRKMDMDIIDMDMSSNQNVFHPRSDPES